MHFSSTIAPPNAQSNPTQWSTTYCTSMGMLPHPTVVKWHRGWCCPQMQILQVSFLNLIWHTLSWQKSVLLHNMNSTVLTATQICSLAPFPFSYHFFPIWEVLSLFGVPVHSAYVMLHGCKHLNHALEPVYFSAQMIHC